MDSSLLISLVRKRTELYDSMELRHRDRTYITKLWREIAQEMNSTEAAVRSRWQILRSNYMREKRKLRWNVLSQSSGKKNFKSTWPYFKPMTFLDSSLKVKEEARELTEECCDGEKYREEDRACSDVAADDMVNSKHAPVTKRMVQNKEETNPVKILKSNERNDDQDADIMFFKSLLPSLKLLSPVENLEFKMGVMKQLKSYMHAKQPSSATDDVVSSASTSVHQSFQPPFPEHTYTTLKYYPRERDGDD